MVKVGVDCVAHYYKALRQLSSSLMWSEREGGGTLRVWEFWGNSENVVFRWSACGEGTFFTKINSKLQTLWCAVCQGCTVQVPILLCRTTPLYTHTPHPTSTSTSSAHYTHCTTTLCCVCHFSQTLSCLTLAETKEPQERGRGRGRGRER